MTCLTAYCCLAVLFSCYSLADTKASEQALKKKLPNCGIYVWETSETQQQQPIYFARKTSESKQVLVKRRSCVILYIGTFHILEHFIFWVVLAWFCAVSFCANLNKAYSILFNVQLYIICMCVCVCVTLYMHEVLGLDHEKLQDMKRQNHVLLSPYKAITLYCINKCLLL